MSKSFTTMSSPAPRRPSVLSPWVLGPLRLVPVLPLPPPACRTQMNLARKKRSLLGFKLLPMNPLARLRLVGTRLPTSPPRWSKQRPFRGIAHVIGLDQRRSHPKCQWFVTRCGVQHSRQDRALPGTITLSVGDARIAFGKHCAHG
ncbi:hypothetical protein BCR44DRAFT_1291471 [Catenaria anguillulae PL171]|uniref:Uncharacterized protein n=1 Tax=Catenaria anguillulae PL171 TaxID=765915 RepID=A0A1Y2H7Y0_9FUNG|nr:hypothetical protein BCR44DRAFT_1291471 [Catenaria anguillulae PL171]